MTLNKFTPGIYEQGTMRDTTNDAKLAATSKAGCFDLYGYAILRMLCLSKGIGHRNGSHLFSFRLHGFKASVH